jgi:hypothetical protein
VGPRILGNATGVVAKFLETSVIIEDSELSGNGVGVQAVSAKVRRSQLSQNGIGVEVLGDAIALSDLGTASDPGNNTFANNLNTGVFIDASPAGGTLQAIGNTWNPSTQVANADGKYTFRFFITGNQPQGLTRGKNFTLPPDANVGLQV